MFINNITKVIFRGGDFLVIAKERGARAEFIKNKNFTPRYGHSKRFQRSAYTFSYKNISAFYPMGMEGKFFIVIELSGKEAYFLNFKNIKERDMYLTELSEMIEIWGNK